MKTATIPIPNAVQGVQSGKKRHYISLGFNDLVMAQTAYGILAALVPPPEKKEKGKKK